MEEVGTGKADRCSQSVPSKSHSTISLVKSLDSQIWGALSRELVELIRVFLPPSSLFRFKCVCKHWNLLYSDPGFVKVYNQICHPHRPNLFVLTHEDDGKRVQALYLESFSKWFVLPIDFLPAEACMPLAQDGGLICIGSFKVSDSLWVCNPLTKSWRRLPDCHLRQVCRKNQKPLVNMTVYRSTAYKIVVVGDPSLTNTFTLLKLYDSERGQWTDYLLDNLPVRDNFPSTSVIRDGVLYWCTMAPDGLSTFHLEQGAWSHNKVHFPRLFTPFSPAHLIRTQGRIRLIGLKLGGQGFAIGLWQLMEEEESPESRWIETSWFNASPPVLRHMFELQGIAQQNLVCLATSKSSNWACCDVVKGTWEWGLPVPNHEDERKVYHNWCAYEPRFDISA